MSAEGWATVQAAIAAVSTLGMGWIALQQVKARRGQVEAEKRHAKAEQRMNDLETQVADVTKSMSKEGF